MSPSTHNGKERPSAWIRTFGGRAFYLDAPKPEQIDIRDIAHALSQVCRFGGHTRTHYSVAQHSVLVSRAVERSRFGDRARYTLFYALLHDAAEAYTGDVVSPLKHMSEMSGYRRVERRVEAAVAKRFGLQSEMPAIVRHFDLVLLATEQRDLFARHGSVANGMAKADWFADQVKPLADTIRPWAPAMAKRAFLKRFAELGGEL